jgi:hypothetical protein
MTTQNSCLRTPAAADYVGLAPATLEKLRIVGGGPAYSKIGSTRVVVYTTADLDEWANGRRVEPKLANARG